MEVRCFREKDSKYMLSGIAVGIGGAVGTRNGGFPTIVENADAEQPATGSEGYTIEVPARLTPGESSTVTLRGTWASNCIIAVSADKEVLLTNSIRDTEQKTLNVSFPGIDEYGGDTTSQTFTETIFVEGITDVLFGTWSGRFAYYVDVINPENVIEYLQSKNPFKYYSTINLAVSDVNSGKIGTNATSDKGNAAAGIYTDENGAANVVLLKDTVLSEEIVTKKDMIINLGGRTLSATDVNAIDQISGKLVVDGRLY